jgi:hypothetical protein
MNNFIHEVSGVDIDVTVVIAAILFFVAILLLLKST